MNRIFCLPLAFMLFVSMSLAQGTPANASPRIAPGTIISAELSNSVDAKKVKAGDKVEAKTAVDLLSNGQVVIPKGSKIYGRVTDAKARSKEAKDSMVGIVFERLSMKDGSDLTIRAVIQAMGRPREEASTYSATGRGPIGASGGSAPGATAGQQAGRSGGSLGPDSQGVVGLKGLSLSGSEQASVVSSNDQNVRLESGTQLILRIQ